MAVAAVRWRHHQSVRSTAFALLLALYFLACSRLDGFLANF
jgi:hypothetical protein